MASGYVQLVPNIAGVNVGLNAKPYVVYTGSTTTLTGGELLNYANSSSTNNFVGSSNVDLTKSFVPTTGTCTLYICFYVTHTNYSTLSNYKDYVRMYVNSNIGGTTIAKTLDPTEYRPNTTSNYVLFYYRISGTLASSSSATAYSTLFLKSSDTPYYQTSFTYTGSTISISGYSNYGISTVNGTMSAIDVGTYSVGYTCLPGWYYDYSGSGAGTGMRQTSSETWSITQATPTITWSMSTSSTYSIPYKSYTKVTGATCTSGSTPEYSIDKICVTTSGSYSKTDLYAYKSGSYCVIEDKNIDAGVVACVDVKVTFPATTNYKSATKTLTASIKIVKSSPNIYALGISETNPTIYCTESAKVKTDSLESAKSVKICTLNIPSYVGTITNIKVCQYSYDDDDGGGEYYETVSWAIDSSGNCTIPAGITCTDRLEYDYRYDLYVQAYFAGNSNYNSGWTTITSLGYLYVKEVVETTQSWNNPTINSLSASQNLSACGGEDYGKYVSGSWSQSGTQNYSNGKSKTISAEGSSFLMVPSGSTDPRKKSADSVSYTLTYTTALTKGSKTTSKSITVTQNGNTYTDSWNNPSITLSVIRNIDACEEINADKCVSASWSQSGTRTWGCDAGTDVLSASGEPEVATTQKSTQRGKTTASKTYTVTYKGVTSNGKSCDGKSITVTQNGNTYTDSDYYVYEQPTLDLFGDYRLNPGYSMCIYAYKLGLKAKTRTWDNNCGTETVNITGYDNGIVYFDDSTYNLMHCFQHGYTKTMVYSDGMIGFEQTTIINPTSSYVHQRLLDSLAAYNINSSDVLSMYTEAKDNLGYQGIVFAFHESMGTTVGIDLISPQIATDEYVSVEQVALTNASLGNNRVSEHDTTGTTSRTHYNYQIINCGVSGVIPCSGGKAWATATGQHQTRTESGTYPKYAYATTYTAYNCGDKDAHGTVSYTDGSTTWSGTYSAWSAWGGDTALTGNEVSANSLGTSYTTEAKNIDTSTITWNGKSCSKTIQQAANGREKLTKTYVASQSCYRSYTDYQIIDFKSVGDIPAKGGSSYATGTGQSRTCYNSSTYTKLRYYWHYCSGSDQDLDEYTTKSGWTDGDAPACGAWGGDTALTGSKYPTSGTQSSLGTTVKSRTKVGTSSVTWNNKTATADIHQEANALVGLDISLNNNPISYGSSTTIKSVTAKYTSGEGVDVQDYDNTTYSMNPTNIVEVKK